MEGEIQETKITQSSESSYNVCELWLDGNSAGLLFQLTNSEPLGRWVVGFGISWFKEAEELSSLEEGHSPSPWPPMDTVGEEQPVRNCHP